MRLEHWLYSLPLRLRSLFRRRQVEHDLDEELQYHLWAVDERAWIKKRTTLNTLSTAWKPIFLVCVNPRIRGPFSFWASHFSPSAW